mgnify:CR=1 FL=1
MNKYIPADIVINACYDAVETTILEHRRWVCVYEIVFQYGDKYYKVNKEVPNTEYQDSDPFAVTSDNTIRCTEVELKEVTVKKWVPVA